MATVSQEVDDYYGSSSEGLEDDEGGFDEPSTSGAPTQTQQTPRKRRCRYTEEERRLRRRLANRESARRMRAKRSQAVQELEGSVMRLSERNKQLEQRNKEYARSLERMMAELEALKQQVQGRATSTHTAGTASAGTAPVASPHHGGLRMMQQSQLSGGLPYGMSAFAAQQYQQQQQVQSVSVHQQLQDSEAAYTSTHQGLISEGLQATAAAAGTAGSTGSLRAIKQHARSRHSTDSGHQPLLSQQELAAAAAAAAAAATAAGFGPAFGSDMFAAAAGVAGQPQQFGPQGHWQALPQLAVDQSAAAARAAAGSVPVLQQGLGLPADPAWAAAAAAAAAAQQQSFVHPAVLAAQGLLGNAAFLNPAAALVPTAGLFNPLTDQLPPGLLHPTAARHHDHKQQQQQCSGAQGSSGRPGSAGRPSTPGADQAPPIRFPSNISAEINHMARGFSNVASFLGRNDSVAQPYQQQLAAQQSGMLELSGRQQQQQHEGLLSRLAMRGQLAAAAGVAGQQQEHQQQRAVGAADTAGTLFSRPPGCHNLPGHLVNDSHNQLLALLPGSDPMIFPGRHLTNSADDLLEELLRTMPETDATPTAAAAAAADGNLQGRVVGNDDASLPAPDSSAAAESAEAAAVSVQQQQIKQERSGPQQEQQQQVQAETGIRSFDQQQQQQQIIVPGVPQVMSGAQLLSSPTFAAVAAGVADVDSGAVVNGSSMLLTGNSLPVISGTQLGGQQLSLPVAAQPLQLQQPAVSHQQQQQQMGMSSGFAAVQPGLISATAEQQQLQQQMSQPMPAADTAAAAAATLAARGSAFKSLGLLDPIISQSKQLLPAPAAAAAASSGGGAVERNGSRMPSGFVPVTAAPAAAAAAALLEGPTLDPFEQWAARHGAAGGKGKQLLQNLNNVLVADVPPAPVGLYGPAAATASQQQLLPRSQSAAAADHPRGRGHAHGHHGSSSSKHHRHQQRAMAAVGGEHARKRRYPLKNPSRFSHPVDPVAAAAAERQRYSADDVSLLVSADITLTACHGSSRHPYAAAAASARRRGRGSDEASMLGPLSCVSRVSAAAAAEDDLLSPENNTLCNAPANTEEHTADDAAVVPAVSACGVDVLVVDQQQQQQQQQLLYPGPASEPYASMPLYSDIADGCRSYASEPVGQAAVSAAAAAAADVYACGEQQQELAVAAHQQQLGISPQLQAIQLQLEQQIKRNKAILADEAAGDLFTPAAAAAEIPEFGSCHPNLAASAAAPAAAAAGVSDPAAALMTGAVSSPAFSAVPPAAAAADQVSAFADSALDHQAAAAAAAAEDSMMRVVPSISQALLLSSPRLAMQQYVGQDDVIQGPDHARRTAEDYVIPDSPPQLDALLAAMHSHEDQQQQQ